MKFRSKVNPRARAESNKKEFEEFKELQEFKEGTVDLALPRSGLENLIPLNPYLSN
jgi:hypothetical protein